MNHKKIYPLNFLNTFFFSLLCIYIVFSMLLFTQNVNIATSFIIIGGIIVLAVAIPTFVFYSIEATEEYIEIKAFGLNGIKVQKIYYENIKSLEIKNVKSKLCGIQYLRHYYIVHDRSGYTIINNGRYFIRQLNLLFRYLNRTYRLSLQMC